MVANNCHRCKKLGAETFPNCAKQPLPVGCCMCVSTPLPLSPYQPHSPLEKEVTLVYGTTNESQVPTVNAPDGKNWCCFNWPEFLSVPGVWPVLGEHSEG